MVPGHPFKGGLIMSQGQLAHPDAKRFNIKDAALFAPPRPNAWVTALSLGSVPAAATQIPSFGDFFSTYFAGRSFNVAEPKCSVVLEGMKKCYENNSTTNPVANCQYYIQGFERFACGKV